MSRAVREGLDQLMQLDKQRASNKVSKRSLRENYKSNDPFKKLKSLVESCERKGTDYTKHPLFESIRKEIIRSSNKGRRRIY
ncbi:MAG TPA: hypothetical protein GX745_08165 [Clostridiales bacterium]|nr:hypothetical protein [Clostridiales bacterium]